MKKTRVFALLLTVALAITSFVIVVPSQAASAIRGDVNGDRSVNAKDIILMRQYLANLEYSSGKSSVEISDGADIDRDGKVGLSDLCLLRKYLVDGSFGDDGIEVTESDGIASVTSTSGLEYAVSGYNSIGSFGLVFDDGINISFSEPFAESFNRFTLRYISSTAVKIYVSYTFEEAVKEDYYFLEAGEGSFSGVILDFLNGKQGSNITGMRVENLETDKTAEFVLYGFSTELADVPDRDYYIEGTRYKLGIDLGWGGTINYVSDNECPITGVENMINKHDTGRLVQQSYYGTGEQEGCDFVWGSFNGSTTWPYNPVQGGCQGNLASRLIDFSVEDNTVYIKIQPMDWGKNGVDFTADQYTTPSYMENWYIIEDEYIQVKNRFVDFSGWEHPISGQELPAFYTIGYLDSFVWYDGAKPWTGDELSWRHELRFWGDSQYAGECSFRIKEPNTETWCAWVSTEDNYGIGLYTPNIDRYSAGRYQYIETLGVSTGTQGSKDASANPTSYVAPWKQKQIVSFEEFEYSYLIAAGSVDEIRATFTENKDLFDNASLNENSVSNRRPYFEESMESMDFTVEGNEKFAIYPNRTEVSYDATEQALKLLSSSGDVHVTFDYLASPDHPLTAEDYKYLEIEYMIPETNGRTSYESQLFICADDRLAANEEDSVRVNLIKDGNYHILRIKLLDNEYWTGSVNLIRFDYFGGSNEGDILYVKSVKLSNTEFENMDKIDFSDAAGSSVISKTNQTKYSYDSDVGATKFTVTGTDPYIWIDYSLSSTPISADDYTKLRITYMVPAGQSNSNFSYALFPCAGDVTAPSTSAQILSNSGIIADGEYHTLEIDLSQYDFWTGTVNLIRFDYFNSCNVGDVFYIKSFELVK